MKKTIQILVLTLMSISCSDFKEDKNATAEKEKLQLENDSLKKKITENKSGKKQPIATFLTFQKNNAENAMNFYVELFDNSEIINVQRWGKASSQQRTSLKNSIFN